MIESIVKWFASGAWMSVAWDLARALVILGVAYLVSRFLRMSMERLRRRAKKSDAGNIIYVIEKIGGYAIMIVGLLAALAAMGVNLESFTLFAGALGVGVGLGLQGIVKEFFSGLQLIFNPSLRVGDFVELEDGMHGEIVEIGTRSTRLRTNDYAHILIPNSTMLQNRVINWTYSEAPWRLHVPFSVVAAADKAMVRDVVLKAAWRLPFSLPDTDVRKSQVWLKGFAGAGLNFELIVWPDPESCRHPSAVHAAYTWAIHDALAEAGITSASPQLDPRLERLLGREGEKALQALRPVRDRPAPARPTAASAAPSASAPNDAVKAVFDDAERDARVRETEPTRRPSQPPPASTPAAPRTKSGGAP